MTAQKLRDAAKVLRERAKPATEGPWMAVAGAWGLPSDGPDHMRVIQVPHRDASSALARLEYDQQGGNDAHYIATMHPGVGLALADWLGSVTACCDDCMADGSAQTTEQRHALAVADLILGGAA